MKSYILILKTLHGDPGENITVVIKGTEAETEKLPIGKSQSHHKTFKENQTDLFLLLSNVNIGKLLRVEFHVNANAKFKEWKYSHIFVVDGVRVYRDTVGTHCLLSSTDRPLVIDVSEPSSDSQESVYYAFIKTGRDSCSKGCSPTLSLFDHTGKTTELKMKPVSRIFSPSVNNHMSLEKHQLDIFQWQDRSIESIERIQLQLNSGNKQSRCHWPVEWMLVVHHGCSFTGRITLNRTVKTDRYIGIDFEQRIFPITGEYGDSCAAPRKYEENTSALNKQSNAITDDVGRYYVMVRNLDGTSGDVYINFHGDRLSSCGEQRLSKCENYPEHPFASKHTDLFHLKASEVGQIRSASLRLDQTDQEHSLTLDTLYVIHNAVLYHFDSKHIILNKQQAEKEFTPRPQRVASDGKVCYYVATHTADQMLSGTNGRFQLVVTGTDGMFGPVELKESLTNGNDPFEKECIDLFFIEEKNIGDPISMSITLESKGVMGNLFSGANFERILLIKDGEYSSHWQLVGALKANETKLISLPARLRQSVRETARTPIVPVETIYEKTIVESTTLSPGTETRLSETKRTIQKTERIAPNFEARNDAVMAAIEDHQKRHTFAPSLQQAEQNYRELRRLLKKMNAPTSSETKTQIAHKPITASTKQHA